VVHVQLSLWLVLHRKRIKTKKTLLSQITRLFEYDICTRTPQLSNFSDWLLFRAWVQTRSQKFDDRKSSPYDHTLSYSQTKHKQQIKTMYIRQKQCSYWKNLEWIWYNQFILISLMLISTLDARKMCIFYQGIPLTGLTIPHLGACPKLGPGFQRHMSLSFFNHRSERWLFVCWYLYTEWVTSRSFPHSWLITAFVAKLTRRVPLVEQELLTLTENPSSLQVFSGVRVTSIFFYVYVL
jgi:hypothetical protein